LIEIDRSSNPHVRLDPNPNLYYRIKGVGVLLSVNRDRLDASSLPESKLDLCQIDPLTLDPEAAWDAAAAAGAAGGEEGEALAGVWMKDDLEARHFVPYKELRKVRSRQNGMNDRWRRWVLQDPLSEGCGPPAGAEEELPIL
jgi:hypothetical protein